MSGPAPDELTAFFTRDHRLIDAALERFDLEAFEALLRRHIGWEEDFLFPAFERKLEEARARCASMRIQHEELKAHVAALRASLPEGGPRRANAEAVLLEALADHNHAEELFIYPWMDAVLGLDERRALLASLGARRGGSTDA